MAVIDDKPETDRPSAPRQFGLGDAWKINPRVAVRPESFGALLYHFGTRKLSFLKDRRLLSIVQELADQPSAQAACAAAGVSDTELPRFEGALAALAASGMIAPQSPASSAVTWTRPNRTATAAPTTSPAKRRATSSPDRLADRFQYGLQAPICLTWELTYACNLSCVHCLSSSGRRDPRELSTEECKAVIDELERMQVFYVNIGGGEPTVRSDFWELLDYATAHHVGVKFSTNGSRITPEVAQRLAASDYVDVQLSLDGATAEVNDAVRGEGTFDTVLRAAENLRAAGFRDFKFSVVVTRHNVSQLDAFQALADEYGAQLRLTRLRPSGRGADVWDELHPTADQQRELYDWLTQRGEKVLTGDSFFHLSAFGDALPGLNLCGAGRVVCLIDPVGTVYACPFAIHENFEAGNVRSEGGFTRVWRESALFEDLRRPQTGGACSSCSAFDSCRGGCMAAKFFTGLPLDGPDPECVRGNAEASLAGTDRGITPKPSQDHSHRTAPRRRPVALGMPVAPRHRPDRACDESPLVGLELA